jgi:hypothetical protein
MLRYSENALYVFDFRLLYICYTVLPDRSSHNNNVAFKF